MKRRTKIRNLISLVILFSLICVINVKADAGPPMFPRLEFEVTNKDGAKCYDYDLEKVDKTFKYGEVVLTRAEDEYSDKYKNYYNIEYESAKDTYDSCYIKKADIVVKQENFKIDDDEKDFNKEGYQIWTLEDVKVYSGPSKKLYKELGTIPKDTKIVPQYNLTEYWYYIEYEDIKGFVSSEANAIVNNREIKDSKYMTIQETELHSMGTIYVFDDSEKDKIARNAQDKVVAKIPANTVLENAWATDYERYLYLSYNDTYGFIERYAVAYNCTGGRVKTLGSLPVYDNLGEGRKKIGTVDVDSNYKVEYNYANYADDGYYVPELKGWLYNNYNNYDPDKKDQTDVIKPRNFVIYITPDGDIDDPRDYDDALFDTIEIKGHDFKYVYGTTTYTIELNEGETKLEFVVTPNNDSIKVFEANNFNLKNNSVVTLTIVDADGPHVFTFNIKANEPEVPKEKTDPIFNGKGGKGLTDKELIILCVAGGVFLALTAVVTIILVNKRKKATRASEVVEEPVKEDASEVKKEDKKKEDLEDE